MIDVAAIAADVFGPDFDLARKQGNTGDRVTTSPKSLTDIGFSGYRTAHDAVTRQTSGNGDPHDRVTEKAQSPQGIAGAGYPITRLPAFADKVESAPAGDVADLLDRFEEHAAVAEYDGGLARADAETLAARGLGFEDADALHRAEVDRWARELRRLAEAGAATPFAARALTVARDFWRCGWPLTAARLGWDDVSLFGAHPVAPLTRIGALGLIPLMAHGPTSPTLIALDDAGAVLMTATGARQRFRRWGADRQNAIPIWELGR